MTCRRTTWIATILATLLLPVAAVSAQTSPQRASCVLRMETDDRYGPAPASAAALAAALTSTALVDPAMQAALDLGPDQWPAVAQVDVHNVAENAVKLSVTLKPSDGRPFPENGARRVLAELTARALKSFNAGGDETEAASRVQKLRDERAQLDAQLEALRAEFETAALFNNRRAMLPSVNSKVTLEQQLAEQESDKAVQDSAVKVIGEKLAELEKELSRDADPDLKALRAKLLGTKIDAEVAAAKATTRIEQLRKRLAEFAAEAAAATQPTRSLTTIQSELNDCQHRRQLVDQELTQLLAGRRQNAPHSKLIVIDGQDHGGSR